MTTIYLSPQISKMAYRGISRNLEFPVDRAVAGVAAGSFARRYQLVRSDPPRPPHTPGPPRAPQEAPRVYQAEVDYKSDAVLIEPGPASPYFTSAAALLETAPRQPVDSHYSVRANILTSQNISPPFLFCFLLPFRWILRALKVHFLERWDDIDMASAGQGFFFPCNVTV